MNVPSRKNLLAVAGGFIAALLFLIFAAAPLQVRFGMTGLALTELGLLALALLGVALFHAPLRQVFSLHRPTLRGVFGSLLLWLGGLSVPFIILLYIVISLVRSAVCRRKNVRGLQN